MERKNDSVRGNLYIELGRVCVICCRNRELYLRAHQYKDSAACRQGALLAWAGSKGAKVNTSAHVFGFLCFGLCVVFVQITVRASACNSVCAQGCWPACAGTFQCFVDLITNQVNNWSTTSPTNWPIERGRVREREQVSEGCETSSSNTLWEQGHIKKSVIHLGPLIYTAIDQYVSGGPLKYRAELYHRFWVLTTFWIGRRKLITYRAPKIQYLN